MNHSTSIANEILAHCEAMGHSVNPQKLIKLCIIAKSWSLAFDLTPLFRCNITAEQHRPMIFNLYNKLQARRNDILPAGFRLFAPKATLSPDQAKVVQSVTTSYSKYDGIELARMTSDWKSLWQRYAKHNLTERVMLLDDIANHTKWQYKQSQQQLTPLRAWGNV